MPVAASVVVALSVSANNGLLSRRRRMLARTALAETSAAPQLDVVVSAPPVAKKSSALSSHAGRTRVAHNLNWSQLGP